MKITRIYLSGPMSGLPQHNYPAFHEAAARWRARGFEVVNPAELDDGGELRPHAWYMRRDIAALCQCDAIALLPGWASSVGALLEARCAHAFDMNFYDAPSFAPLDMMLIGPWLELAA